MIPTDYVFEEYNPEKKFKPFPKFVCPDYSIHSGEYVGHYEVWDTYRCLGTFPDEKLASLFVTALRLGERIEYNKWKTKEIKRREESRRLYYAKQEHFWVK